MSKSKLFLFSLIAFIFGIVVASWAPILFIAHNFIWFIIIIFLAIILFIVWNNKKLRIILFLILFLFLGIFRFSLSIPQNLPNKIWYYNGKRVDLIVHVSAEPKIKADKRQIFVSTKYGKILLFTTRYPNYEYGDELKINCKLESPKNFDNFDYRRYLAKDNIYSVCYYPKIELIDKHYSFYRQILRVKENISNIINRGLIEPGASLARAILLGDKSIPNNLRVIFSKVGLSHVVAVSGMHLGIISVLLFSFFLAIGLPRKKIIYLIIIILILYIMMIGAPVSAVRAGIFDFLALLAIYFGRLKKSFNVLIFAAVIMLIINPRILRDDVGFQLSFLAVFGILFFYPYFSRIVKEKLNCNPKTKKGKMVVDIILLSFSAQLLTLPIVAFHFRIISFVALLSNLFVIWLLPLLLIITILAIVFSLFFPSVTAIIFLPSLIILKYIIVVASFLSIIPYGSLNW